MLNPILEELSGMISSTGRTYDVLELHSRVSRAILCRLAHGKGRFLSVESASKIAHAFGYDLKLVRRK